MLSLNDYQYAYDMFLAENELFDSLIEKGAHIVLSEQISYNEIMSINEGLETTITNYLNKVMNSTQEAWNKFKVNVGGTRDREYLRGCADKVKNSNPSFTVNNFPTYNTTVFRNYKVERFSYELMKDDLKTQKQFMQKHYLSLYSERNNVNVMMERNIITGYGNINVDKYMLIRIFNFCSKDFYEIRTSIEQDLAILNESSNTIIHDINTVISTAQESVNVYESIINELSTDDTRKDGTKKMSFTDSDGEHSEPGDNTQSEQNVFTNAVVNYIKVSTTILSAKMKVLSNMYDVYMDIIKHYVGVTQYSGPADDNNTTPNTEIQI